MYVCVYIYIYIYIRVCVYIYIYIYIEKARPNAWGLAGAKENAPPSAARSGRQLNREQPNNKKSTTYTQMTLLFTIQRSPAAYTQMTHRQLFG